MFKVIVIAKNSFDSENSKICKIKLNKKILIISKKEILLVKIIVL